MVFVDCRMSPRDVWDWIQNADPDQAMPVLTLQDIYKDPEIAKNGE